MISPKVETELVAALDAISPSIRRAFPSNPRRCFQATIPIPDYPVISVGVNEVDLQNRRNLQVEEGNTIGII